MEKGVVFFTRWEGILGRPIGSNDKVSVIHKEKVGYTKTSPEDLSDRTGFLYSQSHP